MHAGAVLVLDSLYTLKYIRHQCCVCGCRRVCHDGVWWPQIKLQTLQPACALDNFPCHLQELSNRQQHINSWHWVPSRQLPPGNGGGLSWQGRDMQKSCAIHDQMPAAGSHGGEKLSCNSCQAASQGS